MNLARQLKKVWNKKGTMMHIVIGALGTVTKGLIKRHCKKNSIVEISKGTKKNTGDLRRLAVTYSSRKS